MLMSNEFASVYSRVVHYSGQIFNTKTGRPFVYQVVNGKLVVNRTGYKANAKSNIRKALALMPASRPSKLNGKVMMPSYIWAILNDSRVQNGKDVPRPWYEVRMTDRSLLPDYNIGAIFYARKVNGKVEIQSSAGITNLFITREEAQAHFEVIRPLN